MASYDSEKMAHIHEGLHSHLPPEPALRVKALENLLVEKGLLKTDAVDKWLDNLAENKCAFKFGTDPRFGNYARTVFWTDKCSPAELTALLRGFGLRSAVGTVKAALGRHCRARGTRRVPERSWRGAL